MHRLCTLALLATMAACADTSNDAYQRAGADAGGQTPAPTQDAGQAGEDAGQATADAGQQGHDAGTIDRGPSTIAVDGDANGLLWDDATQTLFIADDDNNRMLRYTDAAGISKVADLPPAPSQGPGLVQVARLKDGTLLVTRFGYGVNGDVAIVKPDGTSAPVPGLDKTRRRIGIAVAPDGTIFDSYFVKTGGGAVGEVATLTLDGVETPIITGLKKPIGLAVVGDSLYVSDQQQNSLFVAPLATPASFKAFAALPNADLICAGPDGSLFSGGSDGNVRQISPDGKATVFAGGFQAARGVAYDPTHKRIFVADHGSNDTIQIRPVP